MSNKKRLLDVRPELIKEWDFSKNNQLDYNIYDINHGSHVVTWWKCPNCNSSYDMKVNKRAIGARCPYCSGSRVNHTNSLLSLNPELAKEWHLSLNKDLSPNDVTCSSNKKVWWVCPKCKSDYEMSVNKRTNNRNCPYCKGSKVNHTNSLASINPTLASQWHPTLNEELTPHDVVCGSHKKVWWQCKLCHEWEAIIANRSKGRNCPYCANKKLLVGFNDMWTTNPELASLLANSEDGYKYTQGVDAKVDWKCPDCGFLIYSRNISTVKRNGLSCTRCSDGVSFGEKIIYTALQLNNIKFKHDSAFPWSNNKRYDFYIPSLKTIIEVHGRQHYEKPEGVFKNSLRQEIENDEHKKKIAKLNGIENYIVIDFRKDDIDWIKKSISNSYLVEILPVIDYGLIFKMSAKSLIKIVCEIWNLGKRTSEIMELTSLARGTVIKYLKLGNEIGFCTYNSKEEVKKGSFYQIKKNNKPVLQFTLDHKFIREWDSVTEAAESLGISKGNISTVCTGKSKYSNGFIWKHK